MSDAQKIRIKLKEERAKNYPDPDVIYALEAVLPLSNTIDSEAISRGLRKAGL